MGFDGRACIRDAEIFEELSIFLAGVGKTAILYGRFSGSVINPLIYLSWIQQHICRKGITVQHRRMLLRGLALCLTGLEGSAFKAVAPSLLSACCSLLSRPETPITLFDPMLDAMQHLCKVSAAVRDQFTEIVDLVLGWGSCAEASNASAPRIRSFFLQLRPNWQFHVKDGSQLILSVMQDLCKLQDTQFAEAGSVLVFRNTLTCLIAIFEACSPFLQHCMLTQSFGHIRCITRAIGLHASNGGETLSIREFADQLAQQLSISVCTLIGRSVPNAAIDVMKILTEAAHDVQHKPEMAIGIVVLHSRFLETMVGAQQLNTIQDLCIQIYGKTGPIQHLRTSMKRQLAETVAELYKILLCESSPTVKQYFTQFFLEDLKSKGSQRLLLESVAEQSTSGGQIQPSEDSSIAATNCRAIHVCRRQHSVLKQRLVSLTLFFNCCDHGKCDIRLENDVWNAVMDMNFEDPHPLVISHSIKLLRKIWMSTSGPALSAFDAILTMMKKVPVEEHEAQCLLLLQWLSEAVQKCEEHVQLMHDLEDHLLDLLSHSHSAHIKRATLAVIRELVSGCICLKNHEGFLHRIFDLASSTDPELSVHAMMTLKKFGSFCLVCQTRDQVSRRQLEVALQPQIYTFRSSQVTAFLDRLTSGTIPYGTVEDPYSWIVDFGREIAPRLTTEITDSLVSFEDCHTLSELAHFLVHEAAKFLVSSRFRSLASRASDLLKIVNGQLSQLKEHLLENRPVDRLHVWLLLEFIFALQKQAFCGYDGAHLTTSPPQSAWSFLCKNKTSFEEGFGRLGLKLLFLCHRCGFHTHAVQIGTTLLRQQCKEAQKHLAELQRVTAPKQTVLKIRHRPSDEVIGKLGQFFIRFLESIQLTCLSLIHVGNSFCISGIHHEVSQVIDHLLISVTDMDVPELVGWMEGAQFEAEGNYEKASVLYKKHEHTVTEICQKLQETQNGDLQLCVLNGVKMVQAFIPERLSVCYSRVRDWKSFAEMDFVPDAAGTKTMTQLQYRRMEAEWLYDAERLEALAAKMKNWQADLFNQDPLNDPSTAHSLVSLQTCVGQSQTLVMSPVEDEKWTSVSEDKHLPSLDSTTQSEFLKMHQLQQCSVTFEGHRLLEPFRLLVGPEESDFFIPVLFPELRKQANSNAGLTLESGWLMDLCRLSEASDDSKIKSAASLIVAKNEIDNGNDDHAARVLQAAEAHIDHDEDWLQFALGSEKCRLSFLRTENEKQAYKLAVNHWNLLFHNLKTLDVSTADKSSSEVMALWLNRFVQGLEPFESNLAANRSLATFETPDMSIIQNVYYKQLLEAGYTHRLKKGSSQTVSQIQAYCISLSLELQPMYCAAWRQFSQMLLSQLHRVPDKEALLHNSAMALCKCLQYASTGNIDVDSLLEIFSLLKDSGDAFMSDDVVEELLRINPKIWSYLSGQMMPLLGQSDPKARKFLLQVLKNISEVARADILYPVLVEFGKEKAQGVLAASDVQELMHYFQQSHPQILQDASVFIHELDRLNSLISEDWLSILSDAQIEYQVRMNVLNEVFKTNRSQDATQRASQLQDAYDQIMWPLIRSLRRRFDQKRSMFSETPFEKQFWERLLPRFEQVIGELAASLRDNDLHSIQKKWSGIKALLKDVGEETKAPLPCLNQISPKLVDLIDTSLPMPGLSALPNIFLQLKSCRC